MEMGKKTNLQSYSKTAVLTTPDIFFTESGLTRITTPTPFALLVLGGY